MRAGLSIYTIYAWGTDGVEAYSVRQWVASAAGVVPVTEPMRFHDLDLMRAELRGMGLTLIARSIEDEPNIMETWL